MLNIKLWDWSQKPRTTLRSVKVGDIICFEIDSLGTKYGYGQIISKLTAGFAFRGFDISHENPNDITIKELENAKQLGDVFILDAYSTLDHKKFIQNGEWRVIGHQKDFQLTIAEINSIFFSYGVKGMKRRKNLLNESIPITDEEAENYVSSGPATGDQAKMWYLRNY